jgi:hypothetical protein
VGAKPKGGDGAFYLQAKLNLVETEGAEYAIKAPFFPRPGLKERIVRRRCWQCADERVEYFEQRIKVPAWSRTLRVVSCRKRVMHGTAKNDRLDLFDPNDGYYEYAGIVKYSTVSGRTL